MSNVGESRSAIGSATSAAVGMGSGIRRSSQSLRRQYGGGSFVPGFYGGGSFFGAGRLGRPMPGVIKSGHICDAVSLAPAGGAGLHVVVRRTGEQGRNPRAKKAKSLRQKLYNGFYRRGVRSVVGSR